MTPALADANNGNWQTAQRWATMLSSAYRVRIAEHWSAAHGSEGDDALLVALHARRSAAALAAWRASHPDRPSVLVLTGTDLYRDIASDSAAQASLRGADRLVVLNQLGAANLPAGMRAKTRVVLQSCASRQTLAKPTGWLRALMVGHLREEKSPQTYFDAARLLHERDDIHLDHIGGALDPALGALAAVTMTACPRYRWLGERSHEATRRRIQRAHVLVHASRMEGGANVVIEAVRSGTPVLASRIDGNVGLLGEAYGGYFAPGDAAALAALLRTARDDPAMLAALSAQCAARAPLFDPAREREALHALLAELVTPPHRPKAEYEHR